ncbi:MAG TPA: hypothetical protein VIL47_00330 [Candidatus Bipolaricaulota bacterium]
MSSISRLAISISVLIAICSTAVRADVTGTFNLDITMSPQGTQTEAVRYAFDIQSNFQFLSTFSGISFGADLGFGITGIEFAVMKLAINLGALDMRQDSVFAVPFGCTLFGFPAGNGPDEGVLGQCPGKYVVPLPDADGDGVLDANAVAFVKSRSQLELNIAGITLTNLLLFEDVDFPDIQGKNPITGATADHEHDHFNGDTLYNIYAVNGDQDDQTPTFGVGDVITISGQTVSGISIISETAICAGLKNHIKKRSWDFEVNKGCAVQSWGFVVEGGGSPFLLEEQRLWIKNISAENFLMDIHTVMSPLKRTVEGAVNLSYTISELASVIVTVEAGSGGLQSVILELKAVNATVTVVDVDADLQIDYAVGVFSFILNPNENPLDFETRVEAAAGGFSGFALTLGYTRGLFGLSTTTRFAPRADGSGFAWARTSFRLGADAGIANFSADFSFSPGGISDTLIALGFLF